MRELEQLIGVQIGTTSLAAVTSEIKPDKQPQVFRSAGVGALARREMDDLDPRG